MVEVRRGPGRPAYGSREKLVAATCALLSERGLEATSPTMIVKRSGVGQGSMYHHFEGKNDVALAAIRHMRTRTLAILQRDSEDDTEPDDGAGSTGLPLAIDTALDSLFAQREGRALLRLLTDPAVAESEVLWREVQGWCYEIRAYVYVTLGDDAAGGERDERNDIDKLHEVGDPILTAALGRALLSLAR